MTLWTVGHGNRSSDELVSLLGEGAVDVVVDVRRYPASRRNPQFHRDAIGASLAVAGIGYQWWGEVLGGRRKPIDGPSRHPAWRDPSIRAYADHMDRAQFRATFSELLSLAARERVAIMCSESLWWRCHRRLLSDAAELAGTPVVHLVSAGRAEPHRLDPALRRDGDGWPVYDVGVPRELQ